MLHLSRFVDVSLRVTLKLVSAFIDISCWPHRPFGKAIAVRLVCNAASIFVVAIVSNGWFGGLQDSNVTWTKPRICATVHFYASLERGARKPAQLPNQKRQRYSSTTTAAHSTPRRSRLSLRLTAGNAGRVVGGSRGTAYLGVGPT